jgi:outer membrane protein OmpA-like peptidoglycan-associated protein
MNKKLIGLGLLLLSSTPLMAENSNETSSHHEATGAGIGLIAGSLIGGPIGAIIGGSMGVMNGHHQTLTETIKEQQQRLAVQKDSINHLEQELSQITLNLAQAEKTVEQLMVKKEQTQNQHGDVLAEFAESYQFDIYFLTNSSELHPQAKQGLKKLAQLLQTHPQLQANLEAHSDWRGSNDDNCLLAKQRLAQVNNNLTQTGVNPKQLLATNYGEHQNYDTSSWDESLFYDRRVTIFLTYFAD